MKSLFCENSNEERETGRHSLEHGIKQKRIMFRIAFGHWKTLNMTNLFKCLNAISFFEFLTFPQICGSNAV